MVDKKNKKEKKDKEDLALVRKKIDLLDKELINLFNTRMKLSKQVAKIKRENNFSITDNSREEEIIKKVTKLSPSDIKNETNMLMRTLISLSKNYQRNLMFEKNTEILSGIFLGPKKPKTTNIKCAFAGIEGAWAHQASLKVFPKASFVSEKYFEDVFLSVRDGDVDYGVLPIENSNTGAIGETYDLLRRFGCYIVKQTRIKIDHCLMAKEKTNLSDIKKIYSHNEGFMQCRKFISKFDKKLDAKNLKETSTKTSKENSKKIKSGIKTEIDNQSIELIASTNTAVACKTVKKSKDKTVASIGSKMAAEIYGLKILKENIVDHKDNKTTFVVIAKNPEYKKADNKIAITFSLIHRSGSLCETLFPFLSAGVNLLKIESRPASFGSYRFFVEIEGNILDEVIVDSLSQASAASEYFEVLGCYSEV